jgi:hypothetical protein
MDRATIGIMTASLVIGSSIVMMIPGGADPVRGIAAHLLRAGGLSGRIREQPVGYLFDLAPRTAMTERAQPVDAVRCTAGVPVLALNVNAGAVHFRQLSEAMRKTSQADLGRRAGCDQPSRGCVLITADRGLWSA